MNMNDLAIKVAKREAGKVQVSIAQIKEILAILSELLAWESCTTDPALLKLLLKNGRRRNRQAVKKIFKKASGK